MARNLVQAGIHLTVAAPAAVASGGGVLVGSIFGVASFAAGVGEEVEISTVGVYELPKLSAQAWTVGQRVYWDAAAGECTTVDTGNTLIGVATEAAANPSDLGIVRLNGSF